MDDLEYKDLRSKCIFEDPELMKVEFSLKDQSLRLNTSEDAEKYARLILETDGITDVCLSGNTFGVGAGRAIAAALRCQSNLKVSQRDFDLHRVRKY